MGRSSVDVGILVALREEFALLFQDIEDKVIRIQDEETGHFYYRFPHQRVDKAGVYDCVATFMGNMGKDKAALLTSNLLDNWNPTVIIMLGIAAGISDDVCVGDIVVADEIQDYLAKAKAVDDPSQGFDLQIGGEHYKASIDLIRVVNHFPFVYKKDYYAAWQQDSRVQLDELKDAGVDVEGLIEKKILRRESKLELGHLASGDIVGASKEFTKWLKNHDRKYLALDMESAGLMAAVYEKVSPNRTLIIRAISDYGDERKPILDRIKNGSLRKYAMRNAIRLLWYLMDADILPRSKQTLKRVASVQIGSHVEILSDLQLELDSLAISSSRPGPGKIERLKMLLQRINKENDLIRNLVQNQFKHLNSYGAIDAKLVEIATTVNQIERALDSVQGINHVGKTHKLVQLHQWLKDYFNEEDLRHLCFILNVDYDNVPGYGKVNKARELILYLKRHSRLDELENEIIRQRPNVSSLVIPKNARSERLRARHKTREDNHLDTLVWTLGWCLQHLEDLLLQV